MRKVKIIDSISPREAVDSEVGKVAFYLYTYAHKHANVWSSFVGSWASFSLTLLPSTADTARCMLLQSLHSTSIPSASTTPVEVCL